MGLAVAALAYTCGRYAGLRAGGAGALALFAVLAAGGDVVPALLCTVAPWAVGRVVRAHDTLVKTLRGRTAELEAEQESLARLAVAHERARVARELHDIVAHHLAVVVVQAGAGRVAPDPREDPERMARIDRSAEEALSEMSRLAGLLEPHSGDAAPLPHRDAEATGLKLACGRRRRRPARARRCRVPRRPGGADERDQARPRLRGQPPSRRWRTAC